MSRKQVSGNNSLRPSSPLKSKRKTSPENPRPRPSPSAGRLKRWNVREFGIGDDMDSSQTSSKEYEVERAATEVLPVLPLGRTSSRFGAEAPFHRGSGLAFLCAIPRCVLAFAASIQSRQYIFFAVALLSGANASAERTGDRSLLPASELRARFPCSGGETCQNEQICSATLRDDLTKGKANPFPAPSEDLPNPDFELGSREVTPLSLSQCRMRCEV